MRSLVILTVCLTGVVLLSRPPAAQVRGPHQRPLMARKELLQILGAPYKNLLADYYWIQTTHTAGVANSQAEYADIYYYADMTTDLDPRFRSPYVFAGVTVPFNYGRERWTNVDESTAILTKGLAQFPDDVFMRMLLAYNLSYFHKQYRASAEQLEYASRLPGAPSYLGGLATRLYAQSGDADAGLELAASLAANAQDQETRESFEKRIKELQLERLLQQVEAAAKVYFGRVGHWPVGLHELVLSGDLPTLPEDPLGGHLYLGQNGEAFSTSQSRRLRAYDPLLDRPGAQGQ